MRTKNPDRTPEQLAKDLEEVIAKFGPTRVCTSCKVEKHRSAFCTVRRPGKPNTLHSLSICRRCGTLIGNRRRKRLATQKNSPAYIRLRAAAAAQQRRYLEKKRARLQAIDDEAMANPLAKKVVG